MRALLIILLFVSVSVKAQTTYILVRHAEKEAAPADPKEPMISQKDPMLSKEGQDRAVRLAALLEKQHIDAIYSTNFNRTKNTAKPLADSKKLEIQIYDRQPDVSKMTGTVVIVGHSNTIPALANQLLGKEEYKNFDETDFGNILIIKDKSVVHLRY